MIEIPPDEYKKIHQVLRLSSGEEIAILPNDGSVLRCVLDGRSARVIASEKPNTESSRKVTVALGLPRQDKLEESIRMATEIGASAFVIFPAARSVVKWEAAKFEQKLARLRIIAREACEVAYRTRLPEISTASNLEKVLQMPGTLHVMSESDKVLARLPLSDDPVTLVIGPEGGWAPHENALIGDRAVSMGPRVFRVDTAAVAAVSLALLRSIPQ